MPRKAKEKKGGRPIRPPKRPAAPPPSSSEDEDEEMGVIRALIGRMEALERARNVPSDPGAGTSGGGGIPPPKVPRRTRGAARSQLLKSLSSRLEALEKAGAPAGPDTPSEPSGPSMPSPDPLGQPAPARPPDPVPALPGPVSPQPVAPAEQPLRDPSLPLAPGAGGAPAPVQVLVCGHSLVFWAFRWASTSQWGTQLGFGRRASIYWLGMRGMLWGQLLPTVRNHLDSFPAPQVVILHLGENDLGRRTGLSIIRQAASDFKVLRSWIPGVYILWVNWLQRRVWRGVSSGLGVEKARRKASAALGHMVRAAGGKVVLQPGIAARLPQLYRPDRVHLSEVWCDLYLSNIRRGLAEFLEVYGAGRSSVG
ncbi:RNA-binding protein 12-like isoform X1 [Hemicordylus capensis]|uniref:RNA-binding protein 12-like isoform X1 n=1 Tax=Hemicordylus capensis TaxID=884348 RepID=UPI002304CF8C|nr:RNA-binding protein 12-like isoform X1 [Hemicordylus capensis]